MNKQTGNFNAAPIFLAFLCMGFGDVVGPMVSLAKESFQLSNFMAQLLPLSGFIMFGILSVPMGIFQDRKGKKFTLLLGLFIAFIGLLIPILAGMYGPFVQFGPDAQGKFMIILLAILLLGAGATILQVSGNPIMRDVSPVGRYSSNLSFGQTVKAIGSSFGFLIPAFIAKPLGLDWTVLFPIYAVLILIVFIWIQSSKIIEKRDGARKPATLSSCIALLSTPYVLLMVLGIFVYVGAEVSMSSGVPLLLNQKYGIDVQKLGLFLGWALFFLPLFIGRLIGGVILRSMSARQFLIVTVLIAISGILLMFFGSQFVAYIGIIMVGLGFANIFPLIFSMTIDKMPQHTNELSGLMVMAIVGGALIPPVFGAIADYASIMTAFFVPLICLAYIILISFFNTKKA